MEKAELGYQDYKKGMKYKDIAAKYNVPLDTVKSWKRRQWAKLENGVQSKEKKCAHKMTQKNIDKSLTKTKLLPEELETLANEGLTEKQRLFCLYYARWFNATKAYQHVYGCDYNTAMVRGCETLRNIKVRDHIQSIKDAKIKQSMYKTEDLFQKMMDIAYSDITDFMSFGRRFDEDTGIEYNYIDLSDSEDVDGTLIQEVKRGKDGISVKLVSKEFALKWLDKNIGIASEEQRARIDKIKAETIKLKDVDKEQPINITFTKASDKNGDETD